MTEKIIHPDETDAQLLATRTTQVIGVGAFTAAGVEGYAAVSTGEVEHIVATAVLTGIGFIASKSSIRGRTQLYLDQRRQIRDLERENAELKAPKDPMQEVFEGTIGSIDSSMM